jgi:hypothetical protein
MRVHVCMNADEGQAGCVLVLPGQETGTLQMGSPMLGVCHFLASLDSSNACALSCAHLWLPRMNGIRVGVQECMCDGGAAVLGCALEHLRCA